MKNAMNNDGSADKSNQPSGAKGSVTGAQVASGGVEEMLGQLHQILAQLTQSVDSENENAVDAGSQQQLMDLSNQLAAKLEDQGDNTGEPALQVVLQIIDTLADMLDNGQITLAK